MLPAPRHRGVTTMRTLLTSSLNWEQRREQGLMVFRVKPIPFRFPMDSTPLHSIPSACQVVKQVCNMHVIDANCLPNTHLHCFPEVQEPMAQTRKIAASAQKNTMQSGNWPRKSCFDLWLVHGAALWDKNTHLRD